jgi:hypothetical protein
MHASLLSIRSCSAVNRHGLVSDQCLPSYDHDRSSMNYGEGTPQLQPQVEGGKVAAG